jgi:hypothetical protein
MWLGATVQSGEGGYVAKTKRHTPFYRTMAAQNVGKIHRLRLHIAPADVELLSLPTRPTGTSEAKREASD